MAFRRRGLIAALASALWLAAGAGRSADPPELRLATTTSLRDSGLLGEILPAFTTRTGIRVKVIASEGGAGLELARRGEADLVISHDPDSEEKLLEEGVLVARRPFAESFSGTDPVRRNLYSVLLVPPDRFQPGRIRAAEARALFVYLVEPATLERIGRFRAGAGPPLFHPLP